MDRVFWGDKKAIPTNALEPRGEEVDVCMFVNGIMQERRDLVD